MLNTILIGAAAGIVFSWAMSLSFWTRKREIDAKGNPMLRFLAAPYVMFICGLGFLAVGISQWLDPINHHYSGNLLLLSYIPIVISIAGFCLAAYFWNFRIILREKVIEQRRWPFSPIEYRLDELQQVEKNGQNTLLKFSGGRKLAIYYIMSGREYFLEQVER